jgi:large subunit ribosomal protein L24e
MPVKHVCSFCGREIEPGTGKMYVLKNGTVLYFCSSKCQKNMIKLHRVPRRVRWTEAYRKEKEVRLHLLKRRENEAENPSTA